MAQHDYVIANGTGAAVRSDLNNALAAIVSQNSGATEPATTYAFQFWADTTTSTLKLRNSANNAWIELMQLDGTLTMEDGTEALPGLSFRSDLDTGLWRPGANQLAISTNAVERVEFGASEVVFNDGGANYDFRVEGDTNANLLFVDASADAVGIGSSAPASILELKAATPVLTINGTAQSSPVGMALAYNGTNYSYVDWQGSTGELRIASGEGGSGNYIRFRTNGTNAMTIDSSQRVGIGTTTVTGYSSNILHLHGSTGAELHITTNGTGTAQSDGLTLYVRDSDGSAGLLMREGNALTFGTTDNERARIDSSGRLLVGTSTTRTLSGVNAQIQLEGTSENTASQSFIINENSSGGVNVTLGKTRGTSIGGTTVVNNNDDIGTIRFSGSDGTSLLAAALIRGAVDGTPGANDMPGRLVFSTTADGASSPTERMRIRNDGFVFVGKTTADAAVSGFEFRTTAADEHFVVSNTRSSGGECLVLNRQTGDGTLISFYQANTIEGSISVSGTTVQLNGAHLSRWSQLPGGAERTQILRGSVLSNLDEMCEWGDEDNEQLNRTKISDVEGDKNVAGVFVAWDDDDIYTNDFYCAMTGDFIIRIGAGVIVERGDLLMSAGDGTAKPQDDDIIRSKTIAKVTSTHVTCTYDDGSYCVPCVLMAC